MSYFYNRPAFLEDDSNRRRFPAERLKSEDLNYLSETSSLNDYLMIKIVVDQSINCCSTCKYEHYAKKGNCFVWREVFALLCQIITPGFVCN